MISKLLVVAGAGSYLRLVAMLSLGAMSAMAARAEVPSVTTNDFGNLSSGKGTKLYTLQGVGGLRLDVSDFGGRVVRLFAPDRNGVLADVTLGFNRAADYETYGFTVGTLVGRFANRIAKAGFALGGEAYNLVTNELTATRCCNLHSGPTGWDSRIWTAETFIENGAPCIRLRLEDQEYNMGGGLGYPGNLSVTVTYRVLPNNVWTIDYEITSDQDTVVNPTHHSYWNLAGESSGDVLGQKLQIFASRYLQADDGLIPTNCAAVAGTGFDFTSMRGIGDWKDWMRQQPWLAATDHWYDHCFVLDGYDGKGECHHALTMYDPASGRRMEVWTDQPGVQMYGGQNFADSAPVPAKEADKTLCACAGVALELQHFPDSPNQPDFPSTTLKAGETYRSHSEYRFGTLTPAGVLAGPFDSEAAAAKAIADETVVFGPTDEVRAVLEDGAVLSLDGYKAMFTPVVFERESNEKWYVMYELNADGTNALERSVQAVVTNIDLAAIATAPAEGVDMALKGGLPGFYYTLFSSGDVTAVTDRSSHDPANSDRICDKTGAVTFEKVTKPSNAAGFFTVSASAASGDGGPVDSRSGI